MASKSGAEIVAERLRSIERWAQIACIISIVAVVLLGVLTAGAAYVAVDYLRVRKAMVDSFETLRNSPIISPGLDSGPMRR